MQLNDYLIYERKEKWSFNILVEIRENKEFNSISK